MNTSTNTLSTSEPRKIWSLTIGAAAILLGMVFLTENFTGRDLDDLWAVALLPIALGFFIEAWQHYRETGSGGFRFTGTLLVGFTVVLAAVALLFNLDIGELWPLFFILAGFGAVLNSLR